MLATIKGSAAEKAGVLQGDQVRSGLALTMTCPSCEGRALQGSCVVKPSGQCWEQDAT